MKRLIKKTLAYTLGGPLFHAIPSRKVSNISPEQAVGIIEAHSPNQGQSALCNHAWSEPEYDLTIIVPVYNAEKYLKKCLDSILSQKTALTFHVVVVNDGSTDNSREILNDYNGHAQISIVHQENGGASKARNTALQQVKGRYIMFVDADDFLPENTVDSFMRAAYEMNADVVQGGYFYTDDAGVVFSAKSYKKAQMCPPNGTLSGLVCGKIYAAKLFAGVHFPENVWYEDTIITAIITHLAENIVTIPNVGYYYRQNPASMTSTGKSKPKSVDTYWVHQRIMQDRCSLGMVTDCAFYEHLLRMVALSYRRTEMQPKEVKIALMILWKDLLEKERKDGFVLRPKYKRFEKAIRNCDYGKYSILSKYCF